MGISLTKQDRREISSPYFKFGTSVPRDSTDMTPKNYPKGAWPWSRDSVNFWALNANNSKTVKAVDLKFDKSDSPDMPPKIFPKGGVARVTWPPKFFGVKC